MKGDKAALECKLFGSPDPHVEWSRVDDNNELVRNVAIKLSRNFFLVFIYLLFFQNANAEQTYADGKATLILDQLASDEQGTYRCVASNKYGTAQAEGSLVVKSIVSKVLQSNFSLNAYLHSRCHKNN